MSSGEAGHVLEYHWHPLHEILFAVVGKLQSAKAADSEIDVGGPGDPVALPYEQRLGDPGAVPDPPYALAVVAHVVLVLRQAPFLDAAVLGQRRKAVGVVIEYCAHSVSL